MEKYSDYDVYCFTSTTPQFNHVRRLAQAVKAVNPEAKTILGGPHTRYFLTHEKDAVFDYVVTGYGINKDVELIESIFAGNEPDFWRIDTTEYYDCPKDFSLIPEERRIDTLWYNFFSIGCPNRCKYCVEHKVGKAICFVDISKRMVKLNDTIEKVTFGIDNFQFNTSVARMMELFTAIRTYMNSGRNSKILIEVMEATTKLMAPEAPHLAEYYWEQMGHTETIFKSEWPEVNKDVLKHACVNIPVQINSKNITVLSLPKGTSEEDVKAKAASFIDAALKGRKVVKTIFVPDRIINYIAK